MRFPIAIGIRFLSFAPSHVSLLPFFLVFVFWSLGFFLCLNSCPIFLDFGFCDLNFSSVFLFLPASDQYQLSFEHCYPNWPKFVPLTKRFVKQANIAQGHQQVNNLPEKDITPQNELLRGNHAKLDSRATPTAAVTSRSPTWGTAQ